MSRKTATGPRKRWQDGSAMVEYAILALLAAAVLAGPGERVVDTVVAAIRQVHGAFTHALSITFVAPD